MYILIFINFLLICFVGVFLFNQLKEKEDDIDELYNLYYEHLTEDKSIEVKKNKKGSVIKFDRSIF